MGRIRSQSNRNLIQEGTENTTQGLPLGPMIGARLTDCDSRDYDPASLRRVRALSTVRYQLTGKRSVSSVSEGTVTCWNDRLLWPKNPKTIKLATPPNT